MKRYVRFEVDLDLLAHNLAAVRKVLAAGPPGADGAPPRIAAVLKADAYGLGAVAVGREFLAAGADLLTVAYLPEALELRRELGDAPVLIMGYTPTEFLGDAARAGFRVTLFEMEQAEALSRASAALGARTPVHVKIDTGLNRLGIKPDAGTPELLARMADLPGIRLEGIYSHLAFRNGPSDHAQFALLRQVIDGAAALGVRFPLRHIADSISILRYPEFNLDMVRLGGILFGNKPMRVPLIDTMDIRTPFALRARLARVAWAEEGSCAGYDDSWKAPAGGALLATVPLGFSDGYTRRLSHKGQAVVRGMRVPVVGVIMMDQLILDVTQVPDAVVGDEALFLGRAGDEEVGTMELADWTGTNRNEIISVIGRRVTRVYHRGGTPVAERDYLLDPQRGI